MDRIRRVSIVGMGALGILYGDFFAGTLGQEQVTFLADSDREVSGSGRGGAGFQGSGAADTICR